MAESRVRPQKLQNENIYTKNKNEKMKHKIAVGLKIFEMYFNVTHQSIAIPVHRKLRDATINSTNTSP